MFQLYYDHAARARDDVLSGLTVAFALVPEAVAFAFVAGVNPLVGLYGAFLMGLVTSLIGGRPGMISGATGATAVVMVSLVALHGVEYLFAAVVLTGLLQVAFGGLKFGKYIRMVPYPVMLGFVNGLAIVIFLAQMDHFKVEGADGIMHWLSGPPLFTMLGLVSLTMAIMYFLPKFTRAIPAGLAAIITISLIVIFGGVDTKSVGDIADISGGFPAFHLPAVPLNLETLWIVLPFAVILAGVGLIESLLTMSVVDEMTGTRGQGNRVSIGQGVANTVNGFFGGMGGCAMIGQTMINVSSGGLRNLSGIAAALFLLMFIMFGSDLIAMVPLAALVGLMFMVVIGTFEWGSFNLLNKVPREDSFVGILVATVTVFTNLATAVIVGVIASALMFSWKQARHIYAIREDQKDGSRIYRVHGPLFFASVHRFGELFDPANDPDEVYIDCAMSRIADHSAIEAIDNLAERYKQAGKHLHLTHLSRECVQLLTTAADLVEVNFSEDPSYHVADDKLA
ncbi:MAG: sodium-independent anion transporter [Zetaproteobacteria bacterium CG12_big_fil_rev_8_21_14_0_65_55_1124]|nr:MAG: sodium-independent anion transporter [Zetaproteobacteria bacterium CG1_02_55_237]PIS20179.1 MAG: sodium-independent anion transporter [Zetaproteobacteria bacterium CG08_land_8_20_14_0_20_55_17]PIW42699.1 MAG: sodium-independent anion transporter [Zetaproteobacteria bacterium CG12_big_fil_rev_8_21_14_0_65_55_1124]PIY53713.1 MAG: sodium-independent anion transporter [Zetaproteobacteria bacterium CG_4_10_14_0_8_um_filter_55_43]PIZ38826.1 MAG: sodium-independent anion transporter [Zetaprote